MTKTAVSIYSLLSLTFISLGAIHAHGNTSSTTIRNTVNTNSSTSTSQSNSYSKVTITCDGKTYTYESNGEAINADPCGGKSKVNINNNGTSGTTTTTTITPANPTEIKKQVEEKTAEIKKKIEVEKEKIKATITAIPKPTQPEPIKFDLGSWLRSLFASLFK